MSVFSNFPRESGFDILGSSYDCAKFDKKLVKSFDNTTLISLAHASAFIATRSDLKWIGREISKRTYQGSFSEEQLHMIDQIYLDHLRWSIIPKNLDNENYCFNYSTFRNYSLSLRNLIGRSPNPEVIKKLFALAEEITREKPFEIIQIWDKAKSKYSLVSLKKSCSSLEIYQKYMPLLIKVFGETLRIDLKINWDIKPEDLSAFILRYGKIVNRLSLGDDYSTYDPNRESIFTRMTDDQLAELLSHCERLEKLGLYGMKGIRGNLFNEILAKLPCLNTLQIENLPNLESFHLSNHDSLASIDLLCCKSIQSLHLENLPKLNRTVGIWESRSSMVNLRLQHLPQISIDSDVLSKNWPCLKNMHLEGISTVLSINLKRKNLPCLESLHVQKVTTPYYVWMDYKWPCLKYVHMEEIYILGTSIKSKSLESVILRGISGLESLAIMAPKPLETFAISELPSLKALEISDFNLLSTIPVEMRGQIQSITIYKSENIGSSEALNETLRLYPNLETVELDSCNIDFPLVFEELDNVKKLKVVHCESLASATFRNLPKVEEIKIDECELMTTLTKDSLPSLTILSLNWVPSLVMTPELVVEMYGLLKNSNKPGYILSGIDLFSSKFGENHPYVAELWAYLFENSDKMNESKRWRMHKDLLEKEVQEVEHRPHSFQIVDETNEIDVSYNINPEWIRQGPQLEKIPFTFSKFVVMVEKLKTKLANSPTALRQFQTISTESFEKLEADSVIDFYKELLDEDAEPSAAATSSQQFFGCDVSASEAYNSMTSYQLRCVLRYIDEMPRGRKVEGLTRANKALVQLLMNVRTCPAGKKIGLMQSYYQLSEDKVYDEEALKNISVMERIGLFIQHELRRSRNKLLGPDNVDDKIYLQNLFRRELGLTPPSERIFVDPHITSVSEEIEKRTKQESLDHFYGQFTTEFVIKCVKELYDRNHIEMGEKPGDKWTILSQTLNNTQESDETAKAWDPRFIEFADDLQIFPTGITPYATGLILESLGVLVRIS